ncbi:MAG: GerMN domain-containing protein [Acidimicrobiales bacterium]
MSRPVYLVAASQHVAPVLRNVPIPADLTQVLGALLEGPTASETAAGLQSFLVGRPSDVHAVTFGGIVTVDFSTNPVQVVGPDQILAIAQVVFTAMAQPGVTGVTFEIGGTAVQVPTAGGQQVPGPVTDATYAPQAPVPPATSTPSTAAS